MRIFQKSITLNRHYVCGAQTVILRGVIGPGWSVGELTPSSNSSAQFSEIFRWKIWMQKLREQGRYQQSGKIVQVEFEKERRICFSGKIEGGFDNSMQSMTVAVIICFAYEPKKIYTKITQCARSQCGQHLGEFDTDWKVRLWLGFQAAPVIIKIRLIRSKSKLDDHRMKWVR